MSDFVNYVRDNHGYVVKTVDELCDALKSLRSKLETIAEDDIYATAQRYVCTAGLVSRRCAEVSQNIYNDTCQIHDLLQHVIRFIDELTVSADNFKGACDRLAVSDDNNAAALAREVHESLSKMNNEAARANGLTNNVMIDIKKISEFIYESAQELKQQAARDAETNSYAAEQAAASANNTAQWVLTGLLGAALTVNAASVLDEICETTTGFGRLAANMNRHSL